MKEIFGSLAIASLWLVTLIIMLSGVVMMLGGPKPTKAYYAWWGRVLLRAARFTVRYGAYGLERLFRWIRRTV